MGQRVRQRYFSNRRLDQYLSRRNIQALYRSLDRPIVLFTGKYQNGVIVFIGNDLDLSNTVSHDTIAKVSSHVIIFTNQTAGCHRNWAGNFGGASEYIAAGDPRSIIVNKVIHRRHKDTL